MSVKGLGGKTVKKLLAMVAALAVVLAGCGSSGDSSSSVITVNGSTSVESFFKETLAPQIKTDLGYEIEYQATGSSSGIQAAIDGTADFGTASRELDEEEASQLSQEVLAYDGIAIVTNPENGVTDLTSDQVAQIFKGEITNWSEVGGDDADIVVVSREPASGTRSAIEEILGFEDQLVDGATIADGNGNVASTVAENPNAIGYVSFTTLDENSDKINGLNIDGAAPTALDVINETYPISRPFLLVYKEDSLTDQGQELIDWLAETGRSLAPDAGLIEYTEE